MVFWLVHGSLDALDGYIRSVLIVLEETAGVHEVVVVESGNRDHFDVLVSVFDIDHVRFLKGKAS